MSTSLISASPHAIRNVATMVGKELRAALPEGWIAYDLTVRYSFEELEDIILVALEEHEMGWHITLRAVADRRAVAALIKQAKAYVNECMHTTIPTTQEHEAQ